jgi:bacterioferritin (cytochrome b1)
VNENKKDPMEVDEAIDALNVALRLQQRSLAELDDARHLVEKITTLGGEPAVEIAPIEPHGDSEALIRWLIDAETEAIEALQDVIPTTGQEGRSEALEHRLAHIIMRKQEQVDALIRATGGPSSG